jgi:SAM-dependent methyltransferase
MSDVRPRVGRVVRVSAIDYVRDMVGSDGNTEAITAWNTILFDKFVKYRPYVSTALGAHGDRAIERLAPTSGARIVDIGCGFGDTTAQIAERVGATGLAVGVDAAERFIEQARSENRGRPNVRFEVADVERAVPGGPYDAAYSRMGTMFFASPVIALRNIRKSLVPGGKLCMVVWRKKDANECFYAAELIVRELLGEPAKGDQVTCGPGPFSMASPDLVSDQLRAAGYTSISFERSDAEMLVGDDMKTALDIVLTIGPAGEVMRLAGDEAVKRRAEIEAAVAKAYKQYERADGVFAPSSTWIVTAS